MVNLLSQWECNLRDWDSYYQIVFEATLKQITNSRVWVAYATRLLRGMSPISFAYRTHIVFGFWQLREKNVFPSLRVNSDWYKPTMIIHLLLVKFFSNRTITQFWPIYFLRKRFILRKRCSQALPGLDRALTCRH